MARHRGLMIGNGLILRQLTCVHVSAKDNRMHCLILPRLNQLAFASSLLSSFVCHQMVRSFPCSCMESGSPELLQDDVVEDGFCGIGSASEDDGFGRPELAIPGSCLPDIDEYYHIMNSLDSPVREIPSTPEPEANNEKHAGIVDHEPEQDTKDEIIPDHECGSKGVSILLSSSASSLFYPALPWESGFLATMFKQASSGSGLVPVPMAEPFRMTPAPLPASGSIHVPSILTRTSSKRA